MNQRGRERKHRRTQDNALRSSIVRASEGPEPFLTCRNVEQSVRRAVRDPRAELWANLLYPGGQSNGEQGRIKVQLDASPEQGRSTRYREDLPRC